MKSTVLSFLLEGLWLGLLICAFLQVGLFLCLLYKLNWKKVTHEVILVFDKKIKRKRHISISWKEECRSDEETFVDVTVSRLKKELGREMLRL